MFALQLRSTIQRSLETTSNILQILQLRSTQKNLKNVRLLERFGLMATW